MPKRPQLTPKIIYSFIAILFVLSILFLLKPKVIEVETTKIQSKNFVETLQVDGKVKSKRKVTITARAMGDLGPVDLEVGDLLAKGDIITRLKWDFTEPVRAPISGIVSKVYRESAGPIARGEPIIEIIDPQSLQIEAEVLTTEAVKIPFGAPVNIEGWGNEKPLQGKVTKVSRAGFMKLSALGIEEEKTLVFIEMLNPPANLLGDNFHVELDIHLSEEEAVLTLPLGALFKHNEQWALYTVEKNRARLKIVNISKRNNSEAVVTEGLHEGAEVILFPGDRISDKTRVRAR